MLTVKGVTIKFNTRQVTFYPLTLDLLQSMEGEMDAFSAVTKDSAFNSDRLNKMLRVFTASAQLGDPTITENDVRKVVNTTNMLVLARLMFGQNVEDPVADDGVPTSPQIGGSSTPQ
jgi:hypothetical protein